MLNLSPAEKDALDFLASDLQHHVAETGEPVILLQHYPLHAGKRWTQPQIDAFYNVVKGYRILCIMHGHTHSPKAYKWHGIDVLDDGSLKRDPKSKVRPGFMVVRIEGNAFTVVERTAQGQWGRVMLHKAF